MLQKCSGKLYSTDWTEKSTFFKYVHWEGEAAFTVHGLCLLTLPTGKKDLVLALCCSSYLALPNEKLWNSLLCFVYLTFNWHKLDLVCFFFFKNYQHLSPELSSFLPFSSCPISVYLSQALLSLLCHMLGTVSRYVIMWVFFQMWSIISSSETDANYCRIILQFFWGGWNQWTNPLFVWRQIIMPQFVRGSGDW